MLLNMVYRDVVTFCLQGAWGPRQVKMLTSELRRQFDHGNMADREVAAFLGPSLSLRISPPFHFDVTLRIELDRQLTWYASMPRTTSVQYQAIPLTYAIFTTVVWVPHGICSESEIIVLALDGLWKA